jgi:hypothetical protein
MQITITLADKIKVRSEANGIAIPSLPQTHGENVLFSKCHDGRFGRYGQESAAVQAVATALVLAWFGFSSEVFLFGFDDLYETQIDCSVPAGLHRLAKKAIALAAIAGLAIYDGRTDDRSDFFQLHQNARQFGAFDKYAAARATPDKDDAQSYEHALSILRRPEVAALCKSMVDELCNECDVIHQNEIASIRDFD